MTLPVSTLIISSRNRPQMLSDTVASVLQGTLLPDELIIIDQSNLPHPDLPGLSASGDCQVRYIHSSATGVSRARNEGMAAACGEILVLIDDDMQAPADWYQELTTALVEAGPRAIVTGQVLPGVEEVRGGFVPALVESPRPKIYAGRIGADVLPSCHMAMYRTAFEEVGGFDARLGPGTRFPAAEDADYGFQLLEAGYQIVYAPQAILFHRAWRGAREYLPLRWNYGRGKGGFYTKYWSLRDSYNLRRMLGDVLIRLVRFPWRLLHRPGLALGDLAYAFGVLSGSVEWLATYGLKPQSREGPSPAEEITR